jgi:Holliday junction resolvase
MADGGVQMTNYRRGYEIERKVVNMLRKEGSVSVRSAGSHSPWDVMCVDSYIVRLIQCKRVKKYRQSMFDADIKELQRLKTPRCCSKELWVWEDGYGWVRTKVI